ncbi:ribosome silencing factor [Desulfurispira natronophila]|uniref:Ribosomal silencing factor RsfS n=1 Tax=Desulfurispira natronophila TaxID=682562 RepID=A0A7W8DG56_9BACT|nr:ribosome silencing factor [Desulfurispira natronophila]MBB5021077.1 ribosome-associated protein [Desulfurispira natronophila]
MIPEALLQRISQLADEKHATHPRALDLAAVSSFADYFFICTAESTRQAQAIADHITETIKKETGRRPLGQEGYQAGEWILVDLDEVIVHIFTPQLREYYRIEALWEEAAEVELEIPHYQRGQSTQSPLSDAD